MTISTREADGYYQCDRCKATTKRITARSVKWKPSSLTKDLPWHKCYEESLAPEWSDAHWHLQAEVKLEARP